MRSGGANVTTQHIEDLSLCGLFLMEVAKKVDKEFAAHNSTAHTVTDAQKDITKLSNLLLEQEVVLEKQRASPAFSDPTDIGLDKLCNTTWVRDTLDRVDTEDLEGEDRDHGTVDVNYELSHVA